MDEYKEVTDTIDIPRNTGIDGFIHTVRALLKRPRVQEIKIDARGRITCRRFAKEFDVERTASVNFSELEPGAIVRNTFVEEVQVLQGASAAVVLGGLLDMVAVAQLVPLAFVSGLGTAVWDWYKTSTNVTLRSGEYLHGLPLHRDRAIPDNALILMAGLGKESALVDARRSIKIEIPQYEYPDTLVEVVYEQSI